MLWNKILNESWEHSWIHSPGVRCLRIPDLAYSWRNDSIWEWKKHKLGNSRGTFRILPSVQAQKWRGQILWLPKSDQNSSLIRRANCQNWTTRWREGHRPPNERENSNISWDRYLSQARKSRIVWKRIKFNRIIKDMGHRPSNCRKITR